MADQWPLIVARLVTLLPGIWTGIDAVYDGPKTTENPPNNYATIGWADGGRQSGNYSSEQSPDGYRCVETGAIACELNCAVGERDITSVRAAVFTALNALDAQIRSDRRLGILSQEGYFTRHVTLAPAMDINGVAFFARFTLNYFTVT